MDKATKEVIRQAVRDRYGKKDPERFLCILFSDQSDKMLVCFRLKFFVDFFEFHGLNA